jgi:hypothetical protein
MEPTAIDTASSRLLRRRKRNQTDPWTGAVRQIVPSCRVMKSAIFPNLNAT